jgi:hypothetical protein
MPVALLRPPTVRKLVALLRPLSAGAQGAILAQAVHERTMARIGADQVLIALALDYKSRSAPVTRAANNLVHCGPRARRP